MFWKQRNDSMSKTFDTPPLVAWGHQNQVVFAVLKDSERKIVSQSSSDSLAASPAVKTLPEKHKEEGMHVKLALSHSSIWALDGGNGDACKALEPCCRELILKDIHNWA
jgi:hypothetical protein